MLALLELAYGAFPQIHVVEAVAMCSAASRESYKLRFHVGNHLGEVGAKPILASLEGLAGEQ